MMKSSKDIWVFGDYRNYFQNRVTLQILARAVDLATTTGGKVCAIVFGHKVNEYMAEYIAHGAQKVYVMDDPRLNLCSPETYSRLLTELAGEYWPETLLVGATRFGQEMASELQNSLKQA